FVVCCVDLVNDVTNDGIFWLPTITEHQMTSSFVHLLPFLVLLRLCSPSPIQQHSSFISMFPSISLSI
ncbi:unnamed protein product, partial [Musa hybrid cultivar]